MTEQYPLIQFTPETRPGGGSNVTIRFSDVTEVATIESLLAQAGKRLAPLVVGLKEALDAAEATPGGMALIQQELGGQVIQEYPAPPQPQVHYQQVPGAGAAPVMTTAQPQAAPKALPWQQEAGDCWVGTATGGNRNHSRNCPDCGSPTVHTTATVRGKEVNLHKCVRDFLEGTQHKGVWCDSPIWTSKKVKAQGLGIPVNPALVYG